jgi:hypothetical protein
VVAMESPNSIELAKNKKKKEEKLIYLFFFFLFATLFISSKLSN